MKNVVFTGHSPALFLDSVPKELVADNVLKIGHGDCIQLRDSGMTEWSCELHRVTLRGTGPLLRCWPTQESTKLSRVRLLATGCVFDLYRSSEPATPLNVRPALIAWMTDRLLENWNSAIEWQLMGVLVPPEIDVIAQIDPKTGQRSPLDESRLSVDGLVAARFEFAGLDSPQPDDSSLKSSDAPLAADTPLGIDAGALPQDKNYPRP